MMERENAIRLIDVSLDYRLRAFFSRAVRFHALNQVNLEVRKGETLGVMGRNGCGKSSLLKVLAGVIEPTMGKVSTSEGLVRSLLTLGLGFNRELSGRDNALLSSMLQGHSRKRALSLLPKVQEYSELGDFFDQPVKTYSSGMRSRLGFATAIIADVDVLLIDEVLSVGDSQFRKKAEGTMMERIRGDQTVVFVSHSPEQISRLCDRAIWMEQGQILGEGDVKEVSESYVAFVRERQVKTPDHGVV